jgi:hypothetical protein
LENLELVKSQIGTLSDDGDWWCDKKSGWSICPVDFDFEEGDIIEIKPFKYANDGILYTYLVNYYIDGEKIECGWETAMSLEFILENEMVFQDVTMAMKRDKKIDDVLK